MQGRGPRMIMLAIAIAALLGIAAAGGSLVRGTSKNTTAGDAFPYALIGAAAAIVVVTIVLLAIRSVRPDSLRLRPREILALIFVAAALGALIGAALTPRTPKADEVSPLDKDEIERRERQTGQFDDRTRAGSVDRDGDGKPDRDANGNLIIAYDLDGDGQIDGYLTHCPPGTANFPERPGYTPIDNDCDGTLDGWVRYDPDQVLNGGGRFDQLPPVTISPEEREQRAEQQGARGQIGSTLRNVLLILLVVAIGAAIIAYLIKMPDRDDENEGEQPEVPPPPPPVPDLSKSFETSLDAMLEDPDPRRAICAAYGRLLDGLAEVGLRRRIEEAPEEHIRRCLASARMDPVPVHELLNLFSLARFSTHPITESHRVAAVRAMRSALASASAAATVPTSEPVPVGAGRIPPPPPSSRP